MNEKLYRRKVTKGGKVNYEPVFDQFDNGDPADGLWYIKKEGWGHKRKWIFEKLSELPEAKKFASLEPYRDEVIDVINQTRKNPISIDELVTEIFKVLMVDKK